ncbi:MAG: cellobiose phosphorylase, partial [Candidatus Omnitrophica bacterium]|nr:cellobiose phosphorylase [Candidatus Omnitrophota bacterium]
VYKGSVLEHVLLQHLVQFFNVGPHNHIRLEGADWNDGLDMAGSRGESVAFSAFYAHNLKTIAGILGSLPQRKIYLLKEITLLLDRAFGRGINYASVSQKRALLEKYMASVKQEVSGRKAAVDKDKLIGDLLAKSSWICRHIAGTEWLKLGFFNGYYNNDGKRVEGGTGKRARMTLTAQVFPLLAGIANPVQAKRLIKNVNARLKDRRFKGIRLNTDFGKDQYNLGRAFSFIYGEKENGAVFSHMCVMYAYALYKQGYSKEGYGALESLFRLSTDTAHSKIYPCLPEYFNAEGRGMYSYLTGSASWFMFTLLTQAFGIRGEMGNLLIEPKLVKEQFARSATLRVRASFAGRNIEVRFYNPRRKDYGSYRICSVSVNGASAPGMLPAKSFTLSRARLKTLHKPARANIIELLLE